MARDVLGERAAEDRDRDEKNDDDPARYGGFVLLESEPKLLARAPAFRDRDLEDCLRSGHRV